MIISKDILLGKSHERRKLSQIFELEVSKNDKKRIDSAKSCPASAQGLAVETRQRNRIFFFGFHFLILS